MEPLSRDSACFYRLLLIRSASIKIFSHSCLGNKPNRFNLPKLWRTKIFCWLLLCLDYKHDFSMSSFELLWVTFKRGYEQPFAKTLPRRMTNTCKFADMLAKILLETVENFHTKRFCYFHYRWTQFLANIHAFIDDIVNRIMQHLQEKYLYSWQKFFKYNGCKIENTTKNRIKMQLGMLDIMMSFRSFTKKGIG